MKRSDYVTFVGSRENLELDFNLSEAEADIVESTLGLVDFVTNNGTHAMVTFCTDYDPRLNNNTTRGFGRYAFFTTLLPVSTLEEV